MSDQNQNNMLHNILSFPSFREYLNSLKGRSWAEICYEIEEEEERLAEEERLRKLKEQAEERKKLLLKGLYELEDGELLE